MKHDNETAYIVIASWGPSPWYRIPETYLKLKSQPITYCVIAQSFWRFTQSMAMMLSCSGQNFGMNRQLKWVLWTDFWFANFIRLSVLSVFKLFLFHFIYFTILSMVYDNIKNVNFWHAYHTQPLSALTGIAVVQFILPTAVCSFWCYNSNSLKISNIRLIFGEMCMK